MTGTSRPNPISTKLLRIAKLAREAPGMVFTTLAHHIDVEFLQEAYRRTRKDGAVGVDGQTAKDYEKDLEENLRSLVDRFKSGTYKAPPVRRVHIPKGDGTQTRPIGIPTLEDKVLQRAVLMILEAVYEQDFLPCSYGFRPKRSAHDALQDLWQLLMDMKGAWVLEVDVRKFFDELSHQHLRSFLDQRVRDGVLRRMIDKWLKAGVLEDGQYRRSKEGSPQGGVISPCLANIYLHNVLDIWIEQTVKPRMQRATHLIRFADDFVLVFASETDAKRVLHVLPKRFGKYGLRLHPEKTRLVRFQRPTSRGSGKGHDAHRRIPGTFDLLGFRHMWARSRKGFWVVRRKTAPCRFAQSLRRIAEWCRRHRHWPVKAQHQALCQKLLGHYAYYGITGNSYALSTFKHEVARCWRKWLQRRSRRSKMAWDRFQKLLGHYPLPRARCIHSTVPPTPPPVA